MEGECTCTLNDAERFDALVVAEEKRAACYSMM
jgi:hypothetical protein